MVYDPGILWYRKMPLISGTTHPVAVRALLLICQTCLLPDVVIIMALSFYLLKVVARMNYCRSIGLCDYCPTGAMATLIYLHRALPDAYA